MRSTALGFALLLGCLPLAACEDNDLLPDEPRRMDGGLQMPQRDGGMDASANEDAGDTDAGDPLDAGDPDA